MGVSLSGGEVSFLRRVKTGDYEHKEASVKLSFTVGEETSNADAGLELDAVGHMARSKVEEMLGLAPTAAVVAAPAKPEPTTAEAVNKVLAEHGVVSAPAPQPAASRPRRGRPPKVPAPEEVADETPEEAPEEPTQPDAAAVVEDDELLTAAEPMVTDADLLKAITSRNQVLKQPTKIRELIGRYVAPPKQAREIPVNLRPKFIAELNALAA